MRILHFIDSLDYGGAETLLMSYIPLLTNDEHFVVTLSGPNVYEKVNYEYIDLNTKPVMGVFRAALAIRKIIAAKHINIVHSHSFWTNIISRLATGGKIKLINHYHFADYDTMKHKSAVQKMISLDRITSRKTLIRVAVSEYVANNLEKNYALVLQAFETLKEEPISIDIMGGGDRLGFYRNEVKRMDLSKVRFCGAVSNARDYFRNYNLFLSASISETFGLAVLEGVCAKLPLLISNIPAFKEIAPNGSHFFNPYDKNDLVNNLRNFFDAPRNLDTADYDRILRKYSGQTYLLELKNLYNN